MTTCHFQETGRIGVSEGMVTAGGVSDFQVAYDAGNETVVIGLNVTLTWDASSPLTERLNLTAGSIGNGKAVGVEGPSPLTVSLNATRLDHSQIYAWVRRAPMDAPLVGPTNASFVQEFSMEGLVTGRLPESAESPPTSCTPLPGPNNS